MLFVSPVLPALTGGGPAMRAGATLRALADRFRVTLIVTPLVRPPGAPMAEALLACCDRVARLDAGESLRSHVRFDVVHVFRLAALPEAEPWLDRARARQIDMDTLDSVGARRLAVLARADGREDAARWAEDAAAQSRLLEESAASRFDRIFLCCNAERQELLKRSPGAEVVVLPNSLPLPETTPFPPPARGSYVLLFAGTLGDAANADAAHFFSAAILPRIQAGADRPVTLRIVGRGADAAVQRLDGQAGVEVIGEVPDLAPWYRDAHLVVVPMRAGGGTRIKVLEAFAHRRPVVATTIGMEGIAAEDGQHAYIDDDPGPFATDSLRLLHDPELAEHMADEAFALFSRHYTDQHLSGIVAPSERHATP